MGIVTMGPDLRLVEFIKENYQITNFIETGTYNGNTTEWAAGIFENIYSIEFSAYWFNYTRERLKEFKNVNLFFGDTRTILPALLPKVDNAILWLDAHWCGDNSFGEDDQCPLIEELELINGFPHIFDKLFLLIDDARLFLSPPPHPHSLKDYPDLFTVIEALKKERKIYVFNDIIIAVPQVHQQEFTLMLQNLSTEDANKAIKPSNSIQKQVIIKLKDKILKTIGLRK